MASITTADTRAYVASRQETKPASASVNRELSILKRAFRLSLQAGKLLFMPHIPMLSESGNARTGFFERSQFEVVRNSLPPWFQPVAVFAYHTGWRVPSEILTLEWRQVDRGQCLVRLDGAQAKNRKGRVFPYGTLPELCDTIKAQWAETERVQKERDTICPFVFHHDGKPFLDRGGDACKPFRKAWATACKTAGCPGRLLHDFRRTAVRNLVRAGIPEKQAMELTGHKTRSVFDRYDIVNEADLQNAVSRLAAANGTKKGQSAISDCIASFHKAAN